MATDPLRVEEVFNEAVRRSDTAARAAYLQESCGEDSELRARVEALLAAHDATANFLHLPEANVGVDLLSEGPGSRIGRYKLLEQIGEGGFGAVFMAEQTEPVHRKVALKIIKPGMDTRQVIARFEAERQALALMDHPNIAKVLDAGSTDSGRPYFVMELVKGAPIVRYCDEHRLNPRQRLELFIPVCHAVQHAHQKGIIHRDLKPSNVLVAEFDEHPAAMVIDFGVAKAVGQHLTDKTMFTALGQVVGTIEYMSPEQAKLNQLDIDTRTDIYSLGVLLYELLAGSTPLDRRRLASAAFDEMLRIIREEEPEKPSTRLSSSEELPNIAARRNLEPAQLSRAVRGDLDWIVMKALEKERSRRYETANGLARDIDRYLHDEPIEARPPSAAYRLRKYIWRNKTRLAVTGLALFFLVLSAGVIGWSAWDRAGREARIASERAVRRGSLEQSVTTALEEVQGWQKREKWLEATAALKRAEGLLAANADASVELFARVGQWRTDLDTVGRLEEIRLAGTGRAGPEVEATAEKEYVREFGSLKIDIDALPIEESARRVRQSPIREQLTSALDHWARLRRWLVVEVGVPGRTKAWWQRPLVVARTADDEPFHVRVRLALELENRAELKTLSTSPEALRLPASTLDFLTGFISKDWPIAVDLLRRAQRARPDDFHLNLALAIFEQWPAVLATSVVDMDGPASNSPPGDDRSLPYAMAAVSLRPGSAWAWYMLATSLKYSGRLEEARAACRKAIDLTPDFAIAYIELGRILDAQGKIDESIAAYQKAIDLKLVKSDLVLAYTQLGIALYKCGREKDAAVAHRQAIALDPTDPWSHTNLGAVLTSTGQFEEALKAHQKAVELDPSNGRILSNLAGAFMDLGRHDEAIAAYRKAIELEPREPALYPILGFALNTLGRFEEATAICQKMFDLKPPKSYWIDAYCCQSEVWKRRGDMKQALALIQKAMELDPNNPAAYGRLAWLLTTCEEPSARDPRHAMEMAKRAVELGPQDHRNWNIAGAARYRVGEYRSAVEALDRFIELGKGGDAFGWFFLSMANWQLGNKEEAKKWYDKSILWMTDRNLSEEWDLRQLRKETEQLMTPPTPANSP